MSTSLRFFAGHELRLAWREWVGARTRRIARQSNRRLYIFLTVIAFFHVGGYAALQWLDPGPLPASTLFTNPGARLLTSVIIASLFLPMISQGLEGITKVLYARGDIELIRSSPAPLAIVLALRCSYSALANVANTALLFALPVNILAFRDGPAWLGVYGLLLAMGAFSGAIGILLALALYRLVGPKRTRLISQILAAIIGLGFLIFMQIFSVTQFGAANRMSLIQLLAYADYIPGEASIVWWPVRAATGDWPIVATLLAVSAAILVATASAAAPIFVRSTLTIAGTSEAVTNRRNGTVSFRQRPIMVHMVQKELRLLIRDPWLLSQTLMQMIYLVPMAIGIGWNSWQSGFSAKPLIGFLVMAAGQFAGGLAWLTLSAEDAPDLIASAPVPKRAILYAKLGATLIGITAVVGPLVAMVSLADPTLGAITALGAILAAASSTAVQYFYHQPTPRKGFRRRHSASKIAGNVEFFATLAWAFCFGIAVNISLWVGLIFAALALIILLAGWWMAPAREVE